MPDTPLISVIIPAYNHNMYVQQTIESIIEQTYEHIELLIIDDGSTDNTFEKIKAMQTICEKRFVRVAVMTQNNQGVCPTLKKLYSLTQGKYVFSTASDDLLKPYGLETLYEAIKNDEYVLTVGDNEIIDADSKRIAWDDERNSVPVGSGYNTFWSYLSGKRPKLKELSYFGSYESLIQGNYLTNGQLISKAAYHKTGGYSSEAPLEDWYMSLQLSKVGRLKFIDQVLYSYRWHGENAVLQRKKIAKYVRLTMQHERKLIEQSNDSELKKIFDVNTTKTKDILKLKNIFSLYKRKDTYCKQIILEIFGKKTICFTYKRF